MLKLLVGVALASAIFYVLLSGRDWVRRKRGLESADSPRPAYFIGLLFAIFFYFALPLWWWRYGLSNTIKLIALCIAAAAAGSTLIGLTGYSQLMGGEVSPLLLGQLIGVPVRAVAGLWLAKNDERWRRPRGKLARQE